MRRRPDAWLVEGGYPYSHVTTEFADAKQCATGADTIIALYRRTRRDVYGDQLIKALGGWLKAREHWADSDFYDIDMAGIVNLYRLATRRERRKK